MISWKDEYLIEVDEIDGQHKYLFELANKAYTLLKNELITDKYDAIAEIIGELKDYCNYHFSSEEDYMQKTGYRKLLSHKVAHNDGCC